MIRLLNFLIVIIGSALVICFTVAYKTIKAALANPVKNLRTEQANAAW
jgi:hypothetical protein